MIETAPSTRKKAISSSVSESAPPIGRASSRRPTTIPSTAEISDHQKPGALRIQNVVISPMMPLMRNSQPNKMVTARVAIGGTSTANAPRMSSTIPSIRNSTQCLCNAFSTARCTPLKSGCVDMQASAVSPSRLLYSCPRCRYSAAGLSPESLAFQVLVEARDVFAVTVEKKCRPTLTRPDDLFGCLAPAWMRYFRVDVRPEPIFGSLQRLPEALRARVRKSKTHDRLDG